MAMIVEDEGQNFPYLIFNFSFAIVGIHRFWRTMTNGTTTAAHRLESGLVRLARRGTSALSKRRAERRAKRRAERLWMDDR
jgi:hypothetical protein